MLRKFTFFISVMILSFGLLNGQKNFTKNTYFGTQNTEKQAGELCLSPTHLKLDKPNYVKDVYLRWSSPEEVYGIYEDFESHEDFAINSSGKIGWSYLDLDNSNTYVLGDYHYENSGSKMAFQVFNPSKIVPYYSNLLAYPRGGNKYLGSFCAYNGKNNDWIISPQLMFTDSFTLTFYANTLNAKYGLERIKIGYSTTNSNASSFTFVQRGNYIEVPTRENPADPWTKYEFHFPASAKYVAINCVSEDAFLLMIDDIYIVENKTLPEKASSRDYLIGFNLFRDGVKVNSAPLKEVSIKNTVPSYGIYKYYTTALYQSGCESKASDTLTVEVKSIHTLPFFDNFDTWSLETNFWETNPLTESGWMVDYKVGEIVDPMASFRPITNYTNYDNYSLISKELDGTKLDSILVKYDVSLEHYVTTTIERLVFDVWDGSTWKSIKTHSNSKGDFNRERFVHDISEHAAGKMFRIRFRAAGQNSYNVIQWFVDNVKVWKKEKITLNGIIANNGTPIANASIFIKNLEGDTNYVYSKSDGSYQFNGFSSGKHFITTSKKGHNTRVDTLNLVEGSNTLHIGLTAPILNFPNGKNISKNLTAEDSLSFVFPIENKGNGNLEWFASISHSNVDKQTPNWKVLTSFLSSDILQTAIVFDGENFYLSSPSYTFEGTIWKYSKSGEFLESFAFPGIRTISALTFDGRYVYAANGKDGRIEILDLKAKQHIKTLNTSLTEINHLAFDTDKNILWGGSWSELAQISLTGSVLVSPQKFNLVFTGSFYDPYHQKGPSLWVFDHKTPHTPEGIMDLATLRRIDLNTMTLSTDAYSLTSFPGYVHGGAGQSTYGMGLCGTTLYENGKLILFGTIQQDPTLIFGLEMYDLPTWLDINQQRGKIAAGETISLNVKMDALLQQNGDNKEAKINLKFIPDIENDSIRMEMVVNKASDYPRVLNFDGEIINDSKVVLNWTNPSNSNPISYIVYCNGDSISNPTTTTFTHDYLKSGNYSYHIVACYANQKLSRSSENYDAKIIIGIPCYKPLHLQAQNIANKNVLLNWKDPESGNKEPLTLRWGNVGNDDGVGLDGGGILKIASKWTFEELEQYRGMKINSVDIFPTGHGEFILQIYENETIIHSQKIENIKVGEYNTILLNTPIYVNASKNLMVGYEVEFANGSRPVGVDAGPALNNKGNLIYFEDTKWTGFYALSGMNVNWNLSVNLTPANNPSSEITLNSSTSNFKGYNVYKQGVKVNSSTIIPTTYLDENLVPGKYDYSVTALYENCESYPTAITQVEIFTIDNHPAPEKLSANIVLNRTIHLNWDYPNTATKVSSSASMPYPYMKIQKLKSSGEQAVASDGKFIYTSYWGRPGSFNKYSLEGIYIETFTIENVKGIRDLTCDGTYFYGGANEPTLYKLDLTNKTKISEFTVTEMVRHCTYIPELDNGKGGFEIGTWESSYFVGMNGSFLKRGPNLKSVFGSAYHQGKLYYFAQSGESKCQIHEYDMETLTATGVVADLGSYQQFKLQEDANAGGLSTIIFSNGVVALMANLQEEEGNRLVFLEIQNHPLIKGYNLFCNGEKINDTLLQDRTFSDYKSVAATYNYQVSAIYMDNIESPKSSSLPVTIIASENCDKATDVRVASYKKNAILSWRSAQDSLNTAIETVETYADFTLEPTNEWSTLDIDQDNTYSMPNIDYPNKGNKMGFIVFNPTATTPVQDNIALSGKKVFAAFGAVEKSSNDVLISPLQNFTQDYEISFSARAWSALKAEEFSIVFSTSGKAIQDFSYANNTLYRVANAWERYTVKIPANAKYIGINYTSEKGIALLIDDIYIGSAQEATNESVYGYNVYKEGVKLNTNLLTTPSFQDRNLADGKYCYQIETMYTNSCISPKTNPQCITIDFAVPCSKPIEFSAVKQGSQVKMTWEAPYLDVSKKISWSDGIPEDAFGLSKGGIFYIANAWDYYDLAGYDGYSIHNVGVDLLNIPLGLKVIIYENNVKMYEQVINVNSLDENSFNYIALNTPFLINVEKELRIAFEFETEEETFCASIDAGPSKPLKGDLYSVDGINWAPLKASYGKNVNWIISAILEQTENAPQKSNARLGYNVYRGTTKLNENPITATEYTDLKPIIGTNAYKVAAVYETCGEAFTNIINIIFVNNNGIKHLDPISIYPNPTKNIINIEGDYRYLEIIDIYGKILYKQTVQTPIVDLSQFSAGIYILRIHTANSVMESKLFKQ